TAAAAAAGVAGAARKTAAASGDKGSVCDQARPGAHSETATINPAATRIWFPSNLVAACSVFRRRRSNFAPAHCTLAASSEPRQRMDDMMAELSPAQLIPGTILLD
ncbi:MAG: hypothetical protein WCB02_26465, partial [Bradyrhizobium sp.]